MARWTSTTLRRQLTLDSPTRSPTFREPSTAPTSTTSLSPDTSCHEPDTNCRIPGHGAVAQQSPGQARFCYCQRSIIGLMYTCRARCGWRGTRRSFFGRGFPSARSASNRERSSGGSLRARIVAFRPCSRDPSAIANSSSGSVLSLIGSGAVADTRPGHCRRHSTRAGCNTTALRKRRLPRQAPLIVRARQARKGFATASPRWGHCQEHLNAGARHRCSRGALVASEAARADRGQRDIRVNLA